MLVLVSGLALTACGNNNPNTIKFYAFGDTETLNTYQKMVKDFNETIGAKENITVKFSPFTEDAYASKIDRTSQSSSGADVFLVLEKKFKSWSEFYMEPLDSYVESGTMNVDDIWSATVSRYRYNVQNNTSNETDPLYALPIDSSPTALYYNRAVMEDAGIVIIGVAEEDMDKWNSGEIADKYGKYKSDYSSLNSVTVPAKGYWRSKNAFHLGEARWIKPDASTKLVFNDEIPMNWDETEDLAMLFTRSTKYNEASPTKFGFYTEWWFNYGWSVGGDCVQDTTGDGDWVFGLSDFTPNYIVADGKSYEGEYTGTTYSAGETLTLFDKLDLLPTDTLTENDSGAFVKNGEPMATEQNPYTAIRADVKENVQSGVLQELPSTKVAFKRFANLAGEAGVNLNICPYVSDLGTTSSFGYFLGGNVAMIIEEASNIALAQEAVSESTGFDFGVAPLPQYKEYEADGVTVKVRGIESGHSNTVAVAIRQGSKKKEKAYRFIEYLVGEEGQTKKAQDGFVPNQRKLVNTEEYLRENPYMSVFIRCMDTQKAGDWWYMQDTQWISVWADPLNGKVRNGLMTLDNWFSSFTPKTNTILLKYKNKEI